MQKVLIKGAGDLASGIAWRLRRAGFNILMTEIAQPLTVRLTVSYSNAVYEGQTEIEGIKGILVHDYDEAQNVMKKGDIAVIVDEAANIKDEFKPNIIIDAIMAKKNIGTKIDDAPITIAVGPGFCAGKDCDYVIETKRGHFLGSVIECGEAIKNTGVPGNIGGYTVERIIRSNGAGIFKSVAKIGDSVKKGEIVAYTDDIPIYAQIDGIVRGMLHDGIMVTDKMKCGDIDPRAEKSHCFTISDKSRAIGGGALEAVMHALLKAGEIE
ncbi:MAG TPA: EF2563 family selenium-dependent molybdenum hydroxylase system protein [Candidatus Megamonas gallistercoris]|nr:EF2563 family selenium-dependent molybdenum hydroxylase system protein [Candidatus Megamonas gallistercoris]